MQHVVRQHITRERVIGQQTKPNRLQLRIVLAALLVLLSTPIWSFAQEPFTYLWTDENIEAAAFGALSWLDLDGDGDQDLVLLAGSDVLGPAVTRIVENKGISILQRDDGRRMALLRTEDIGGLEPSSPLWLSRVDWTDYDRDGRLDAVVSGTDDLTAPFTPALRLYRNDRGDGVAFSEITPSVAAVHGDVEWGDVDNDGDDDLLVIGTTADGSAKTSLFRNEGGSLVEMTTTLPDIGFGSAAWSDVDNDGILDVALCGVTTAGSYVLGVFRNEGGGSFSVVFNGTGGTYCTIDWGDYDGDGYDDLLAMGTRAAPMEMAPFTTVYRNSDGARFDDAGFDLIGLAAGEARFLDLGSDGFLDIIIAGGSNQALRRSLLTVYSGNGTGFRRVGNLPGIFPAALSLGDIDRDGDLDIAAIGLGQDQQASTTVYLNGSLLVNTEPSAPTELAATVDGGSALLTWQGASDETTPDASLTYNLRIGTESRGNDVMSVPVSIDGRPILSSRGNVVHNTSWRIDGLSNGTYFWSVQAVDNSLATSPFSSEATFQVTASSGGKPVGNDGSPGIETLALAAFPNPFGHSSASISFSLPEAGLVDLAVYDVIGRRVARPVSGWRGPGKHVAAWHGVDAAGNQLASGLYIVRLAFEGQDRTETIVIRR
ncbi:MAG: VCBS repeat-containing protein [Rhodothermia bacterium]|nr:VCBS repeat-containing protein [Rhodothermia bacterium]